MPLPPQQKEDLLKLCEPVIADLDLELVDLDLKKQDDRKILQVLIDFKGGVTLDKCGEASRALSTMLDIEDPFPFEYNLEVSSPGIFRELIKEADYQRFTGERVQAKLKVPRGKIKKVYGKIVSLEGEQNLTLLTEAGEEKFSLADFKTVKLDPEL